MDRAYAPKDEPAENVAPAAARVHVTAADPFKLKAERDAARRAGRSNDRFAPKPKTNGIVPAAASRPIGQPPALRLIASNAAPPAASRPKTPALTLVASSVSASAADAPVMTDAIFTELPKEAASDQAARPPGKGGGGKGGGPGGGNGGGNSGGAGTPSIDRIFNQDDLAGVLIVLALLLLIALFMVRSGGAPPSDPQTLVSTASVEPAPGPLADPFGDKPVDLTPKSPPPPPPAAAAAPAAAPVCPPGRMMRAWFCTAQSDLTSASRGELEKDLADWRPCLTGKQLVVTGYADTRGQADYNVALSSARASMVADVLRAKGVKVAKVTGAGELPGLADNENCANQRRVDVRLSDDPEAPPSTSCAPPEEFAALACG